MFQPLTKDHGDDNHLAVTSAGSGGSQDLGRRPEMASAGFAMDRFVPNKKDSAKYGTSGLFLRFFYNGSLVPGFRP